MGYFRSAKLITLITTIAVVIVTGACVTLFKRTPKCNQVLQEEVKNHTLVGVQSFTSGSTALFLISDDGKFIKQVAFVTESDAADVTNKDTPWRGQCVDEEEKTYFVFISLQPYVVPHEKAEK